MARVCAKEERIGPGLPTHAAAKDHYLGGRIGGGEVGQWVGRGAGGVTIIVCGEVRQDRAWGKRG